MNLKIGSLFLVAITTSNAFVNYKNKIYKIIPESKEQVHILNDLHKDGHYDFSIDIINVGKHAKIMVQPTEHEEFEKYSTRRIGMKPELSLSDVKELILALMQPANTSRTNALGSFDWRQYHTLDQIHNWLDELQDSYSGIVRTVTAGKSHEGREIKGIIFDFRAGKRGLNPLIGMIEGGIHARELISTATITWIIEDFLTSNDADIRYMAETVIWHIFPVIDPDGYVYSFSNNRMWRKNPNPSYNTTCVDKVNDLSKGIDFNRNFKFVWMSTGASKDPCNQSFAEPSAESEPATKVTANYVLNLKRSEKVIYYFAYHSNSQMMLIPFSHRSGYKVLELPNYGDLYEIAIRGAEKPKVKYGRRAVGTFADISYEESAASFNWVKGVANVPIVHLFELCDVDEYSYLLPSEQIIVNNEEIMSRFVEINIATKKLRHYSGTSSAYRSLIFIAVNALLLVVVQ